MIRIPWLTPRAMTCDEVGAVMQQYLDGELAPADVPRVLKHLDACRACGLESEVYTRIKASLNALQPAVDDESLERLRTFAGQLSSGARLES